MTYLRNKWSAAIKELTDEIAETRAKLTKRIDKSEVSEGEIKLLEENVEKSKEIFAYLQSNNADPTMVEQQQKAVTLAENQLAERKNKGGLVSEEDAVLEKVEIEELEWRKQNLEGKIAEIDAVPQA
ncbi:MAG: hypothetical protein AAF734_13170 [Bacteroidota bacterium]